MYIQTLKALRGQNIPMSAFEELRAGQWVFLGNDGTAKYKAVYIGKVNRSGEHVFCEHEGERPVQFGKKLKVFYEYLKEMNGPGQKMPNLLDHLMSITESHRVAA